MASFKELLAQRAAMEVIESKKIDSDIIGYFNKSQNEKNAIIEEIKNISNSFLSYDYEKYKAIFNKADIAEIKKNMDSLSENKKTNKVKIKYLDKSTGDSWTGRGKTPLWLQGKNKEDYIYSGE